MIEYNEAFERSDLAVAAVNSEGQITNANQCFCQLIGRPLTQLAQLSYHEITPEKWLTKENHILINHVFKEGEATYQKEYIHADGHIFPIEINVKLLKGADDKLLGMWAIVKELT